MIKKNSNLNSVVSEFIALIAAIIILLFVCFVGNTIIRTLTEKSFSESVIVDNEIAGGYFTEIREWRADDSNYKIVYANDSKVKYLVVTCGNRYGITPLYNADGSLQLYEEGEIE